MSKDKLGDRMKSHYERRTRILLPRRTYTIVRLDGKAFHTFTKGFDRPFDKDLYFLMNKTAQYLCTNVQGAQCAYVQSDEISLLLTDFKQPTSDAYFDGNIQKIVSITASMATLEFNRVLKEMKSKFALYEDFEKFKIKMSNKDGSLKSALFDSRAFTIPDNQEVFNYFVWRQNDATRNSIQMVAQSLYSHKELHGKNTSELQELIFQKGTNWNDYASGWKRGRMIVKEYYEKGEALRSRWVSTDTPIFTQEKDFLIDLIPKSRNIKRDTE